eukprot:COSAG03_NODE_4210_length_1638_cov_1.263158_3_plen_217_part_00
MARRGGLQRGDGRGLQRRPVVQVGPRRRPGGARGAVPGHVRGDGLQRLGAGAVHGVCVVRFYPLLLAAHGRPLGRARHAGPRAQAHLGLPARTAHRQRHRAPAGPAPGAWGGGVRALGHPNRARRGPAARVLPRQSRRLAPGRRRLQAGAGGGSGGIRRQHRRRGEPCRTGQPRGGTASSSQPTAPARWPSRAGATPPAAACSASTTSFGGWAASS